MNPGLTLENVTVTYGGTTAVMGVSFNVAPGRIVGLLGPNGSGKSSSLAVAAGLLHPVSGRVAIDTLDPIAQAKEYASAVGFVPQTPALYDELSAEANLRFFAGLHGLTRSRVRERTAWGLEFAQLTDRRRERVGSFSGGMKQRLNFAIALLHEPRVILLDEPTAALDPASRDTLFATLHELREAGHAILLTTHHLDEVEFGCDAIVLLNEGRVVAQGHPSELIRHQPGERAVLYARMHEPLPRFFERSLRQRLPGTTEVEVIARRLRLSAPTQIELGQALAMILDVGIRLDMFRTPPGRLEALLHRPSLQAQEAACDVT